jgi:hypothetical protein
MGRSGFWHKNGAFLKLRAPSGQIPAVRDIEFGIINERKAQIAAL